MWDEVMANWLAFANEADLLRLGRDAKRLGHIVQWRRLVQHRSTALARVLRLVTKAAGPHYVGRERVQGRKWRLIGRAGDGPPVTIAFVELGPSKTVEDLAAPFVVHAVEPSMIDLALLRAFLNVDEKSPEKPDEQGRA
jgi:hypothetical protein